MALEGRGGAGGGGGYYVYSYCSALPIICMEANENVEYSFKRKLEELFPAPRVRSTRDVFFLTPAWFVNKGWVGGRGGGGREGEWEGGGGGHDGVSSCHHLGILSQAHVNPYRIASFTSSWP